MDVFEVLVRTNWRSAGWRYGRSDRADAEEAAQDAFLQAWQALGVDAETVDVSRRGRRRTEWANGPRIPGCG